MNIHTPEGNAPDAPNYGVQALLTPTQAAEVLAVGTQTLAKWRCYGDGPKFIQVGRLCRYRSSDLNEWIERNARKHTSDPINVR